MESKEFKFTDGEWWYDVVNGKFPVYMIYAGEPGEACQIATLYTATYTHKDDMEANAKLMTAAPKLLEALQEMCEAQGSEIENRMKIYDKAMAIIQKATL